jgi:2-phosphosulfolactate phosphatase
MSPVHRADWIRDPDTWTVRTDYPVDHNDGMSARFVPAAQGADAFGAVVVVDVLRTLTTAAYAFAAGAERIWLVRSIDEALTIKSNRPRTLAIGEEQGRRVPGFDFSNSPAELAATDLSGYDVVQRTSAGTRGVIDASWADRCWCASLVCASATAATVAISGLGEPTYVITGSRDATQSGNDDLHGAIDRAGSSRPAGPSSRDSRRGP